MATTVSARFDADDAGTARPRSAPQVAVVVVTTLAVFMAFLDATIVNIAFPAIEHSFPGAGRPALAWILNAYNIVFAALLVPAGRAADRLGRRRLFLASVVLFCAASAGCALAPSVETLVAARALQGIGAAILVPTSLALLLPQFAPARRSEAVGLWSVGAALAAATGPCLGGLLLEYAGWRWVFAVNLPVGIAIWVLGRRVLVEAEASDRGPRPDLLGSVILSVALGALALAILEGWDWSWTSARTLGCLALCACALPLFALRCFRHPSPAVDPALLRRRSFALANAGTLAFATAFYGLLLCNVLFMTTVWQYPLLKAGAALTPTPVITTLLAAPAGRLADRFGARRTIVPGCFLYAAGVAWLVLHAAAEPDYVHDWLPAAVLAGIGIALAFPVLAGAAVRSLGPALLATGSGLNSAARQIGAVLGVSMVVAVIGTPSAAEAVVAFEHGWLACAGCAVVAGALAVRLEPRSVRPRG